MKDPEHESNYIVLQIFREIVKYKTYDYECSIDREFEYLLQINNN